VKIALQTEFLVVDCANCSVPFGMTVAMATRRQTDGERFFCPSGHGNSWTVGKSDAEKAREVAEEANRQRGLRVLAEQKAERAVKTAAREKKRAVPVAKASAVAKPVALNA
jgi:hypothetical protein